MLSSKQKTALKLEIKKELARRVFWEYCLYMDRDFFNKRQSILKSLAYEMQRLIDPIPPYKELDVLNISLPPRTGKSYLATLFSSWCLGKQPHKSIMRNSVTERLYQKFSKDLIQIMTGASHRGRFNEVFPEIKFESQAISGWQLTTATQGISYFGGGVGGTIIGMGADLLSILDDSVKNGQEALSENALEVKWTWYTSTMDSREEKGVKRLFIGTRWSKYDIVGRLKEQGIFDDPLAKSIEVSALTENDESFCETIHATTDLLRKRKLISDILWEAEWQQHPVEAKGLLYSNLKRFRKHMYFKEDGTPKNPDIIEGILVVGDIADEGMDSLCVPVGYLINDNIYIPDVLFTTDPIEVTQPLTASFIIKHNPSTCRFESNNGGKGFALNVKRIIRSMGNKTPIKWKHTSQNKHTRIIMSSAKIKEMFYFLDPQDYEAGSDYDRYIKELKRYNKTGNVEHDDAPDGTTMLSEYLDKIKGTIRFLK